MATRHWLIRYRPLHPHQGHPTGVGSRHMGADRRQGQEAQQRAPHDQLREVRRTHWEEDLCRPVDSRPAMPHPSGTLRLSELGVEQEHMVDPQTGRWRPLASGGHVEHRAPTETKGHAPSVEPDATRLLIDRGFRGAERIGSGLVGASELSDGKLLPAYLPVGPSDSKAGRESADRGVRRLADTIASAPVDDFHRSRSDDAASVVVALFRVHDAQCALSGGTGLGQTLANICLRPGRPLAPYRAP